MLGKLSSYSDRHYLPLEAVSLKGKELIQDWERTTLDQRTGADLWQIVQDFTPGLTVVIGNAGTGKSTLIRELATRGSRAVDTDTDEWSEWVTVAAHHGGCGTGTRWRMARRTSSGARPFASASGWRTIRWRRVGRAIAWMSSGVT